MPADRGRGPARAALRRAPRAARGLARASAAAAHRPLAADRRSPTRTSCEQLWAATRDDRHRGHDAEAPRQPLRRRPAQGPVVQVEARAADARLRADVRPARLAASARPTIPTTPSASGATRRRRSRELVPVGKAYFGFTDEELLAARPLGAQPHDRELRPGARGRRRSWCSRSPSTPCSARRRHKSGVAMRFPRIHRIRWDKPAAEADRLETLVAMIEG